MEIQDSKPTTKGPAEYFTGDVWIDSIAQAHGPSPVGIGVVHFSPGARTAWHAHAHGQTLYVLEGEGRVQSRGESIVKLHPGHIVFTPGEEWHWHGAAPDRFMTHISMAEGAAQWADHVTDDEYGGPR